MVKRFLVTTALEETWPKDPKIPVLFLGEWCRIYSRTERWSKMNAEVLPYHWDDREKLFNDYQYLNDIYENMLKALQKQLNDVHQVDHSLRYWRILVGPWLGYFLQMIFDRWTTLKNAFEKHEISCCLILEKDDDILIPNDMEDFNSLFVDDNWNEMIYSQLLQEYFKENNIIKYVRKKNDKPLQYLKDKRIFRSLLRRLKRSVVKLSMNFNNWIQNSDKYFFLNTYLPSPIEDELLLRLGQKSKKWKISSIPKVQVNYKMREWVFKTDSLTDDFSNILNQMIPKHIPIAYLEGYQSLMVCTKYLGWPQRPKCIFTSNAYSANDIFKAWAAEKIECDTPLVIGQHGGHYGMTPWAFHEEHQVSISDAWLSWGWSNEKKTTDYTSV